MSRLAAHVLAFFLLFRPSIGHEVLSSALLAMALGLAVFCHHRSAIDRLILSFGPFFLLWLITIVSVSLVFDLLTGTLGASFTTPFPDALRMLLYVPAAYLVASGVRFDPLAGIKLVLNVCVLQILIGLLILVYPPTKVLLYHQISGVALSDKLFSEQFALRNLGWSEELWFSGAVTLGFASALWFTIRRRRWPQAPALLVFSILNAKIGAAGFIGGLIALGRIGRIVSVLAVGGVVVSVLYVAGVLDQIWLLARISVGTLFSDHLFIVNRGLQHVWGTGELPIGGSVSAMYTDSGLVRLYTYGGAALLIPWFGFYWCAVSRFSRVLRLGALGATLIGMVLFGMGLKGPIFTGHSLIALLLIVGWCDVRVPMRNAEEKRGDPSVRRLVTPGDVV